MCLFSAKGHSSKFNRIVSKYLGDSYVKSFTCWNQMPVMMFGQLSGREGLRDLVVAVEAHRGKAYHLGFGKGVTRSNLAKANARGTTASSRSLPSS